MAADNFLSNYLTPLGAEIINIKNKNSKISLNDLEIAVNSIDTTPEFSCQIRFIRFLDLQREAAGENIDFKNKFGVAPCGSLEVSINCSTDSPLTIQLSSEQNMIAFPMHDFIHTIFPSFLRAFIDYKFHERDDKKNIKFRSLGCDAAVEFAQNRDGVFARLCQTLYMHQNIGRKIVFSPKSLKHFPETFNNFFYF
jgi:hypothetical protein